MALILGVNEPDWITVALDMLDTDRLLADASFYVGDPVRCSVDKARRWSGDGVVSGEFQAR